MTNSVWTERSVRTTVTPLVGCSGVLAVRGDQDVCDGTTYRIDVENRRTARARPRGHVHQACPFVTPEPTVPMSVAE
jgi:hypothetical protein